ncbi:MAG: tRNA lysidine(34) synthetase TilS [Chitinophagales bacterium]|nr:tRNA lysidine(34) synthetase TilS [Chitinophagales bacterium]
MSDINLLARFLNFAKGAKLPLAKKRTLLAVSGGIDSVVLVDLFHKAGFRFEIAHCNFGLRGEESDGDETFVKALAERYEVHFHTVRFDMGNKSSSVQEEARTLRYNWFEQIRKANKLDYIATAHHADDQVETVLQHFVKGTGIRGLRGMKVKRDLIVRPLLFAFRDEIESYCNEQNLNYRTDSSNASLKYERNKVRHELIPMLQTLNPNFKATLIAQLPIYQELEGIYNRTIAKERAKLFIPKGEEFHIPILMLKKKENPEVVLYEFLKDFGFNKTQTALIVQTLSASSGKRFLSSSHQVIKDRTHLMLSPLKEHTQSIGMIDEAEIANNRTIQFGASKFTFSLVPAHEVKIKSENTIAYFDYAQLQFPLTIRYKRSGDYFYPFGMKNKKKKVSKFFKDMKLNLTAKEDVAILLSGERIAWVVDYRTDERFKITTSTTKVLVVKVDKTI